MPSRSASASASVVFPLDSPPTSATRRMKVAATSEDRPAESNRITPDVGRANRDTISAEIHGHWLDVTADDRADARRACTKVAPAPEHRIRLARQHLVQKPSEVLLMQLVAGFVIPWHLARRHSTPRASQSDLLVLEHTHVELAPIVKPGVVPLAPLRDPASLRGRVRVAQNVNTVAAFRRARQEKLVTKVERRELPDDKTESVSRGSHLSESSVTGTERLAVDSSMRARQREQPYHALIRHAE